MGYLSTAGSTAALEGWYSGPERQLAPSDEALDRALEGVSAERIREDLEYLASDELAGRDTPSPGLELAADYIEERLSELGFEHGARTGFVDHWTRSWVQLDTEESFLALEPVDGGEGAQRLSFGEGYFLVSPREMTDLSAEGELISVGDGSKSEVRKADLEGAWAVTVWPEGSILAVARRVQEEGAVGLLVLPVGEEAIGRLGNTTRTLSDGQFADVGEGVFPAPVLGVEDEQVWDTVLSLCRELDDAAATARAARSTPT